MGFNFSVYTLSQFLFPSRHIQSDWRILFPFIQGLSVCSGNLGTGLWWGTGDNRADAQSLLTCLLRRAVITLVFTIQVISDIYPIHPLPTCPWSHRETAGLFEAPSVQTLCALVPALTLLPALGPPRGVDPGLPEFSGSTELSGTLHMYRWWTLAQTEKHRNVSTYEIYGIIILIILSKRFQIPFPSGGRKRTQDSN